MRRRHAVGTVMALMSVLVIPANAAVSGWTIQPTVVPLAPQGVLSAVACSSSTACTAVGYAVNARGATVTSAQRANGSIWTIQTTPSPVGAPISRLAAVACPSATACTAVGYYVDGAGRHQSLIERWNGTAWTSQTAAVPNGASSSSLTGVQCSTASLCTAVGDYVDFFGAQTTLAIAWNGGSWSVQATPSLSGATSSVLNAVACTTARSCAAVGSYTAASGDFTLAERWNGTAWTLQTTVDPSGASSSALNGVSCPTATSCTAVGAAANSTGLRLSLAESWNGSAWAIESTPTPSGATNSILRAVSCASATACASSGAATVSGAVLPLAETWTPSGWAVKATPMPANATSGGLHGISCTGAAICTAVGFDAIGKSQMLVDRLNGAGWILQRSPSPQGATTSELHGVSCATTSACAAAGYFVNSAGISATLAEIWNGTSWSIKPTPNPAGAKRSTFNGVACSGAASCLGVGYSLNAAGRETTLAQVWNGSSWTSQPTPNPGGARDSLLAAASCPSSTACVSVGNYVSGSDVKTTLAQTRTGAAWTISPTPTPTGATASILRGLSCTAINACVAVGSYVANGITLALAEKWDGASWSIQPTPHVPSASASLLVSVSCTLPTACTAVGHYVNGAGASLPLSERWNGTAWATQTTPAPPGAQNSVLIGISCAAATSCSAVGYAASSSTANLALAEAWNGTSWAIESTPTPAGAIATALNGVTCTAATICTASGYSLTSASMPLAMHR